MSAKLPIDILLEIVLLLEQADLKRVCEASRVLNSVATPLLYSRITLDAIREPALEGFILRPKLDRTKLPYVRHVQIRSMFHDVLENRCIHNCAIGQDHGLPGKFSCPPFDYLLNKLVALLKEFEHGKLKSFSWDLGICMPVQLLGPQGYLTIQQPNLESIRLITGGFCDSDISTLSVGKFSNLKVFSWRGLQSWTAYAVSRDVILKRSTQLEELEFDFIRWPVSSANMGIEETRTDGADNFFAWYILHIPPDGMRSQVFPALRELSLSAVSFRWAGKRIAYAFDFSSLRLLRLRFCPGWEEFIQHANSQGKPIGLRSLEIQSNEDYAGERLDPQKAICDFLQSFDGLEDLFISLDSPPGTLDILRSAARHRPTLKRFIHQRTNKSPDPNDYRLRDDQPDLAISPEEFDAISKDPSANPFSHFNLECVGLCCLPKLIRPIISALKLKTSLKIIHIRQSGANFQSWGVKPIITGNEPDDTQEQTTGPDDDSSENADEESIPRGNGQFDYRNMIKRGLRNFAQWAFGPEGFPSLSLIVFGDCSYDCRHSFTTLLCRNTDIRPSEMTNETYSYRTVEADDHMLLGLYYNHFNFVEACPSSLLFEL